MNIIRSIIISILLMPQIVFTQKNINVGFQTGFNLSTISLIKIPASISPRMGYMVGLLTEIRISENISIQPELLYTEKGAEGASDYGTIHDGYYYSRPVEFTWIINYISIPINLEVRFASINETNFYVFAGPNISFRLLSEVEKTIDFKTSTSPTENCEPIDYSLDLGTGFEQRIGHATMFFVNLRYSHGINDINKDANESWKTRSFQLLAGIKFSL